MERWKRSKDATNSKAIEEVDKKIVNDPDIEIINKMTGEEMGFGRGGYCYMFKPNGSTNVYRLFCDDLNGEVGLQAVADVYVDKDGQKYYDDARDYKWSTDSIDNWYTIVKDWVAECELDDPRYTVYYDADTNEEIAY